MKKQTKLINIIELEDKDIKPLTDALKYTLHRIKIHSKYIGSKKEEIERLIKELCQK